MAEQLFGLDISIDEKVWWNFSSHPMRKTAKEASLIPPAVIEEAETKSVKPNPSATQTIDEVVQSSEPFETKVEKLFKGDFRVDPDTVPKYHLLVNFEDKEGIPLVFAMPTFTKQDVFEHFNPKPKTLARPEEVMHISQPEELALNVLEQQRKIDEQLAELKQKLDSIVPEPPKTSQSDVLIPEQEGRSIFESRKISEEPRPEVAEERIIRAPVIPEVLEEPVAPVAPVYEEKVGRRVKFDGQLLANNLLKRIAYDSFHYVKVNRTTQEEPNFLWERFRQRQNFEKALAKQSSQYGSNFMLKKYFGEGVIRSPYLINRYFRNPVFLPSD